MFKARPIGAFHALCYVTMLQNISIFKAEEPASLRHDGHTTHGTAFDIIDK